MECMQEMKKKTKNNIFMLIKSLSGVNGKISGVYLPLGNGPGPTGAIGLYPDKKEFYYC